MSTGFCVHFDRRKLITLEQWRAEISKLGYPLAFPDSMDPANTPGYFDCTFDGKPTSFAIDLNEECELPSPFPDDVDRLTMEFTVNTRFGEVALFGAVAAAASFCVGTAGVIDDYEGSLIKSRGARSWAKSILGEDDAMTEAALKHPHPDSITPEQVKRRSDPWWKWWRR